MQCSSCGAIIETGTLKCNECKTEAIARAVNASETPGYSEPTNQRDNEFLSHADLPDAQSVVPNSKLIEFPGVLRTSVPQWRKELSERVREVQEKRAREDALEGNHAIHAGVDASAVPTPQLELLPHAEAAPLNPLVAAALRRIERAHDTSAVYAHSASGGSAAVAYAEQPEFADTKLAEFQTADSEFTGESDCQLSSEVAELPQPEKIHNLVVVPPQVYQSENTEIKPRPRRMISGDLNDPALNYLDSILRTTPLETTTLKPASTFCRFAGAVADLLLVALFCAPLAAAWELANSGWHDYRVAIAGGAAFAVIGFLYFTVMTGMTGRTLGMRLFSLRIVDSRTGLIPTGSQSAGRAAIYLLSLLTLGVGSLYALLNPDRQTAHDRLSHTSVIHI
ncbi:MAG: RDD family protein [bacterium]